MLAFVAHVAGVDAAARRRRLRQRDHFRGVRIRPGTYCRPVEKPTAPSRMPRSTSACIFAISSGVARRFAAPITSRRTVLWPISVATFNPRPSLSSLSNHCATVRVELPQFPVTTDVTPSRMKFEACGRRSTLASMWVWTSMNPG
jgi:hypothetical protein